MAIQHQSKTLLSGQTTLAPGGWDHQLAHWISQTGSPPVTATLGVIAAGYALTGPRAWLWAGSYALLAILAPALYVLWLYHRGLVSDIHLRRRSERTRPLVVTLALAVLAWAGLYAGSGPALLLVLATANVLQTGLFFGITLHWKISAHAAAAAGLAVLSWVLFGLAALPVLMTVPLIAWARVRLEAHTPAQTIAGAVLGSLILTAVLLIS